MKMYENVWKCTNIYENIWKCMKIKKLTGVIRDWSGSDEPKPLPLIRRPTTLVERASPKLMKSPLTNVQATKLQALQNLQGHPMVHWCLAALLPCCLAALCKGSIRGRGLVHSLRLTPVNTLIHFHTFSYIFIHFHTFSYIFIHFHIFSYIFIHFHIFS